MTNRVISWLLMLGLSSLAFQGSAAPTVAELRVGLNSDIASTEFSTKHDDVTALVLHHIVEGLVAYRDDMTVGPMLAESVSVADEGRTYSFKLRPGLKFHNGTAVTAAIVKWNWDRFRDPKRDWGSHCREWYDGSAEAFHRPTNITAIDTPDERTVVFHLQFASSVFLHHMANNHCIVGIVHPESVAADGSWNQPIGTGPFKLREWRKGSYVVLERFVDYQARPEARSGFTGNKTALVDRLRFIPFTDRQAAKRALLAGKLDVWFGLTQAEARELNNAKRMAVHFQSTPAWHQIVLQTRTDPLLKDPRMRRAIAHAIDPERVTREITDGLGKANPSAVASGLPSHSAMHDQGNGYDVAESQRLLREVGYAGQVIRIQASAQPYPYFHDVAVATANMLNEAGIKTEVETLDWATQERNYGTNAYQMTSITFSTRTDPAFMYSALVGQKTDHGWYLWEDNEAEALVAASTVELDPARRQALFDQLHRKMLDWVPTIGITSGFAFDATDRRLEGYQTWALGQPRFWGVRKPYR